MCVCMYARVGLITGKSSGLMNGPINEDMQLLEIFDDCISFDALQVPPLNNLDAETVYVFPGSASLLTQDKLLSV